MIYMQNVVRIRDGKKSPGLSGEFVSGLDDVRMWSVEDANVRYSTSLYILFVMSLVCCVVDIVRSGMNCDNIVGVVKDGFLHHSSSLLRE